jgi:hypothetical protein
VGVVGVLVNVRLMRWAERERMAVLMLHKFGSPGEAGFYLYKSSKEEEGKKKIQAVVRLGLAVSLAQGDNSCSTARMSFQLSHLNESFNFLRCEAKQVASSAPANTTAAIMTTTADLIL